MYFETLRENSMKKLLIFFCAWSLCAHGNHDVYDAFTLSPEDIAAVLSHTIAVQTPSKSGLTADITFGCADIKYKDGVVKFCECGDGVCMSLRPAWIEVNDKKEWLTAPYWGLFWNYLAQFKLPIWLVGDCKPDTALATDVLASFGGNCLQTLRDLEIDPVFKALRVKNFKQKKNIADYKGIVVYRSVAGRDSVHYKNFMKMYPEFLFVNRQTCADLVNKEKTYAAFVAAGMNRYVPLSKKYSTVYSSKLTESIINDIPTDMVVIKPENCSLACGINVIDKHNLDELLKLILRDKKNIKPRSHRSLAYWKSMYDRAFFVSEYAQSKLLVKENKTYDPTMRIVFFMHHDNNKITLNVIGGFWKIPVKPLDDTRASLTEKHVTIAHSGAYYTGMLCERSDWQEIEACLYDGLPAVYVAMMKRFLN